MNCIGVDGCGGGWVAVSFDPEGNARSFVCATINEIWEKSQPVGLMLVDIPIGLRDDGPMERLCDLEARKVLGHPRSSSVFPVPCREAVHAPTNEEASRINNSKTGRKLSKQTQGIRGKIAEMDSFLQSDLSIRGSLREIHPEVLFRAMNDGKPMKNRKGKKEGFDERMDVLEKRFNGALELFERSKKELATFKVKDDDIVDAMAAAVTARKGGALRCLPEGPETVKEGLRMVIVY